MNISVRSFKYGLSENPHLHSLPTILANCLRKTSSSIENFLPISVSKMHIEPQGNFEGVGEVSAVVPAGMEVGRKMLQEARKHIPPLLT